MNNLKAKVKEIVGQTLMRTGVWERTLQAWARRGEAIILNYHRVIEKWDRTLDYSQPGMVVTADTFDRQLHFLRKYFDIVPLSSLVNSNSEIRNSKCSDLVNPQSAIRNPQSPSVPLSSLLTRHSSLVTQHSTLDRPLCSITFDDGWRDNYDVALPILQKYAIPATIFLTTDFIGTNRAFWHTRLNYVLLHAELSNLTRNYRILQSYPAAVRHELMRLVPGTEAPCAQDVNSIIEVVKGTCDEDAIEELIRDLADAGGVRRPLIADRRFFLDWDHVREMAATGIEMGSHGCSHRILTRLNVDQVEDELIRSKAEIEQRIDQEVRHFAFPDGAANRSLIETASQAGYQSASLLAAALGEANAGMRTPRRVGMHEGASAGSKGSFSETPLITWLLRAPRAKAACS